MKARQFSFYVMAMMLSAAPLAAQSADTAKAPEPFFTHRDLFRLGGFIAGTIAMVPLDKKLARTLQDPGLQESNFVQTGADVFRFMGQPAPQIIGLSLYGVGKLAHSKRAQKLGLHGLESMILGNVITETLKTAAGRARPCAPCDLWTGGFSDTVPDNFKFMRGRKGRDYQSFPSGHATTAFAAAAAVTGEVTEWANESHWWPGWKFIVGTTMYGGAALVGLSRMYHDQHWASDVVAGAAVGTFSGIKVVRYNYRHPHNRLERLLVDATVVPDANGEVYLAWSMPLRF